MKLINTVPERYDISGAPQFIDYWVFYTVEGVTEQYKYKTPEMILEDR